MKTRLIRIGKSRAVRLPKPLLDETGLWDEVEVEVQGDTLIIRPVRAPRAGWAEAFGRMAAADDDQMLDPDLPPPTLDR